MRGDLVEFDDLKAMTGYARQADLERCLQRQGIRFFYGRGGVWTTIGLIEAAGGLRPGAANGDDPYPADLVA